MTKKNDQKYYLVVCTENRLDEAYPLAAADDLKQAVINGFAVYRKYCFKGEDNLQAARESYHDVLYDYVHNPVGYNDHTYALVSTNETGSFSILDLEALLEDVDFWQSLS